MKYALLLAAVSLAPSVLAINIEVDYTYDTGFFTDNAGARAAVEAAAHDLGQSIDANLAAINVAAGAYIYSDANSSRVGINPNWYITNPTTGSQVMLDGLNLAANTVRIYVGARTLGGATLAQGSAGSFGYGAATARGSDSSQYQAVLNSAVSNANAVLGRGSFVTIGSMGKVSVTMGDSDYTSAASLSAGPALGNLWFDSDTSWNYDYTASSFFGRQDIYSTALHEMMHALGVGTSASWGALVTDGAAWGAKDWLGLEGIAVKGSGNNLIASDGVHTNTTGRILDGQSALSSSVGSQDSVMTPFIGSNVRKTLTDFDVALLRDMGYTTAVPEPGAYGLIAGFACLGLVIRRRRSVVR